MIFIFKVLENPSIYEYIDGINKDSLSPITDEMENLYKSIFIQMYKMIQPLDYFSTELISYIGILTQLSKWSSLVRVSWFQ